MRILKTVLVTAMVVGELSAASIENAAIAWDLPMRGDDRLFGEQSSRFVPPFAEYHSVVITLGDYNFVPRNRGVEMLRLKDGIMRCPRGELVIRMVRSYDTTSAQTVIDCEEP